MNTTWPQLEEFFLNPQRAELCKSQVNGSTNGKNKGITLTWSDLTVYVKLHHKRLLGFSKVSYKKLVNNVSGAVESGKLVALMGPRFLGGMLVDGDIRLNGKKVDNSMCKVSGLMRQEDLFIGDLTVKEHLTFMASLKLDRRMCSSEKADRVHSLIKDLGLSHCTNRKIGGSTLSDETELSGGERKRLSFAIACLPDPPLLFCDEPTTGLDSLNAIRIVSMMASWNATILCTIHQPSPEILKYFSSIILVADGSLVFSGSLQSGVDFFKSLGYEQTEQTSAGEFLVSCLAPTPGGEETTRLAVKRIAHQFALSEYAKTSEMHIQLNRQPIHVKTRSSSLHDHKTPFWIFKFFWLFLRSSIEILRNPQIQWIKIAQKVTRLQSVRKMHQQIYDPQIRSEDQDTLNVEQSLTLLSGNNDNALLVTEYQECTSADAQNNVHVLGCVLPIKTLAPNLVNPVDSEMSGIQTSETSEMESGPTSPAGPSDLINVVGLMSGLCYVGAVNKDQAGLQAVQGALFVLVAENTFAPMYAALALFPKELPLLLRELRDGDYHPSALYLAKIVSYLPGLALEAVLFTIIVYWLANLRDTVFAFFMVLLFNILCVMVSAACGMMFANVFDNYELANIYLIPFDNVMMIMSGVYIKLSTLPAITSWFQYFSWLMYSYESMTILQWDGVKDITCSESTYLPCLKTDEEIYEYYSFSESNLYRNLISLVILYICFHLISYIFFVRKIRKHV